MADKAFIVKNGLIVNTNLIYASGSNVGILTVSPDATLAVNGTANVSGAVYFGNSLTVAANITVGSVGINTSMVAVSSSNVMTYNTTLKVYYANNTQAFPT